MRLRVFFANDGDCLLLTSSDQRHVLIDGGHNQETFRKTALKSIQRIGKKSQDLDLVIVTHIDEDHIAGILELMNYYTPPDADWPESTRKLRSTEQDMPTIGGLWHNSWQQQVGGDLAARLRPVPVDVSTLQERADALADLDGRTNFVEPLSPGDGAELLQLVDTVLSSIPRNHGFADDLVALTDAPHKEQVGDRMSLTVLGPSRDALENLERYWVKWIDDHPRSKFVIAQPEKPDANGFRAFVEGTNTQLRSGQALALPVGEVGDESWVTKPNRASIIVLAEEQGDKRHSCLLTGDAASSDILSGLRARGEFEGGEKFRCDIVKFQHHGAEFNYTETFGKTVIGKHYVFCANGLHKNPDTRVVRQLIEHRACADVASPFTLWFNCHPDNASPSFIEEMQAALDAAVEAAGEQNIDHPGLVTVRVLRDKSFFDICLGECSHGDDCVSPDDVTTVLAGNA